MCALRMNRPSTEDRGDLEVVGCVVSVAQEKAAAWLELTPLLVQDPDVVGEGAAVRGMAFVVLPEKRPVHVGLVEQGDDHLAGSGDCLGGDRRQSRGRARAG